MFKRTVISWKNYVRYLRYIPIFLQTFFCVCYVDRRALCTRRTQGYRLSFAQRTSSELAETRAAPRITHRNIRMNNGPRLARLINSRDLTTHLLYQPLFTIRIFALCQRFVLGSDGDSYVSCTDEFFADPFFRELCESAE